MSAPDEYGIVTGNAERREKYQRYAYRAPGDTVAPVVDSPRIMRLKAEIIRLKAANLHLEADLRNLWEKCDRQAATIKSYSGPKIILRGQVPQNALRKIADTVCRHFEVELANLLSDGKPQPWVRARQAAWMLTDEALNISMPRIGKYYNRHHTTVLHGLREAAILFEGDPEWRRRYDAARTELLGG